MKDIIPFNSPYMTGRELDYIQEAHANRVLSGDGDFTKRCQQWITNAASCSSTLLTHSCTAALELAALLLDIKSGDEVILPSYTFSSTANAFVLRGATLVFIDIREDTLNINENLIEAAITSKTKVIVVVHYAGVSCEMDSINAIAKKYQLSVVEDAAQGMMSGYKGRALGTMGTFGTYSFHETKNIICGEGGALLINEPEFVPLAEVIREKGTDRSRFFRGEIDKYTWQTVGSSFLPSEINAAFLWAQLQSAEYITQKRLESWGIYHELLAPLEEKGKLRRPIVPRECTHNGHMYYILLESSIDRGKVLRYLKAQNIGAISHYVPLHSSPAGRRYGKTSQPKLPMTDHLSEKLVRLPLWIDLTERQQSEVIGKLERSIL